MHRPTANSVQMTINTMPNATAITTRYLGWALLATSTNTLPKLLNRTPAAIKSIACQLTSSVKYMATKGISNTSPVIISTLTNTLLANTIISDDLFSRQCFYDNRLETNRFKLIPDSAACIANIRWLCGAIRTINFPLKLLVEIDWGISSPFSLRSFMHSWTTQRIPANAASGDSISQLKLGNSAHKPTYSWSSSDQVTR